MDHRVCVILVVAMLALGVASETPERVIGIAYGNELVDVSAPGGVDEALCTFEVKTGNSGKALILVTNLCRLKSTGLLTECDADTPPASDLIVAVRVSRYWEKYISTTLWQDAVPAMLDNKWNHEIIKSYNGKLLKYWQATNKTFDSNDSQLKDALLQYSREADLPSSSKKYVDDQMWKQTSHGGSRKEIRKACNDMTDECWQASHFTYTDSYKYIAAPPVKHDVIGVPEAGEQYTARLLSRIDGPNGLWTLKVGNALPHDAVAVIQVGVQMRFGFPFAVKLMGGIAMSALIFLTYCGFLTAMKYSGLRAKAAAEASPAAPTDDAAAAAEEVERDLFDEESERSPIVRLRERVKLSLSRMSVRSWRTVPDSDEPAAREMEAEEGHREETEESGASPEPSREEPPSPAPAAGTTIATDSDDDEDCCRICRCVEPKEDLFAPCKCDGSSKYVHRQCLDQWRQMTTNPEHRNVCAECKAPYRFEVTYRSPTSIIKDGASGVAQRIFTICVSCGSLICGGYILKGVFFVVTGFDGGVVWSCWHIYHWFLGFLLLFSCALTVSALGYFLRDYPRFAQQQFPCIVTLSVLPIVAFGFVGQFFILLFNGTVMTPEISFGIGLMVAILFYNYFIPALVEKLEQQFIADQVVAERGTHPTTTEQTTTPV